MECNLDNFFSFKSIVDWLRKRFFNSRKYLEIVFFVEEGRWVIGHLNRFDEKQFLIEFVWSGIEIYFCSSVYSSHFQIVVPMNVCLKPQCTAENLSILIFHTAGICKEHDLNFKQGLLFWFINQFGKISEKWFVIYTQIAKRSNSATKQQSKCKKMLGKFIFHS